MTLPQSIVLTVAIALVAPIFYHGAASGGLEAVAAGAGLVVWLFAPSIRDRLPGDGGGQTG